jgi:hypothetical protein
MELQRAGRSSDLGVDHGDRSQWNATSGGAVAAIGRSQDLSNPMTESPDMVPARAASGFARFDRRTPGGEKQLAGCQMMRSSCALCALSLRIVPSLLAVAETVLGSRQSRNTAPHR